MAEYRPFKSLADLKRLAVIWLNGPASQQKGPDIPDSWFTIWNGASHRMCTDGAANILLKYCRGDIAVADNTKIIRYPDSIIGDFGDSITDEAHEYFCSIPTVEVLKMEDQDCTDLTKTLNTLNEKVGFLTEEEMPRSIVLLGGFSGRFDHILGTMNAVLKYVMHPSSLISSIFAIDGTNVITVLPKGENRIVLDHSKINKVCGLFPICQRPTDVYSKGFRWNIDSNTPFEYGFVVSNSNQIVTDEQVVTSSEPIVFTFELNNKEDLFQSS